MSVPNQKKILIERSSESVRKNFFKVSNESLQEAMYNLDANAFKLWIYFADNANGYSMDLYPCDFITTANVSDDTYRRAFKKLEKKGYLIASTKVKNLYIFKEISDSAEKPVKADVINSVDKVTLEEIKKTYFAD